MYTCAPAYRHTQTNTDTRTHTHTTHHTYIYTTHNNNEEETMDELALLLQSWEPHGGVKMLKGQIGPITG